MTPTLALAAVLALSPMLGCGGRQTPSAADPAEHPLPPSSGTPIGILLDEQTRLRLRSDQIDALREIDSSLSARNESLDAQTRSPGGTAPVSGPPGGFGGRRHGGHGKHGGRGGGPPATHGGGDPGAANDARTANIRDAIDRAMAVLDIGQQAIARQLLDEHGVATATARSSPQETGARGEPGDADSDDDADSSDDSGAPTSPGAPPSEW